MSALQFQPEVSRRTAGRLVVTPNGRATKHSFSCSRPHSGVYRKLSSDCPAVLRLEMQTLVTLHRYLFIGSAIALGLYPLRAYWRIYDLYNRLDERMSKVGFFWFSFYVQSPWFGLRGAELLEQLPQDLRAQASAIRNRQRREINALFLWTVILVMTGFLLTRLSDS